MQKTIKKLIGFVTCMALLYYFIIALTDIQIAYLNAREAFLDNNPYKDPALWQTSYIYAMTWGKEFTYILSKCLLCVIPLCLIYEGTYLRKIPEKYRNIIKISICVLFVILMKYQWKTGDQNISVWQIHSTTNVFVLLALIIFIGGFIGAYIMKDHLLAQERKTMLVKNQMLEERYEEMLKSTQMLHDMHNHILTLCNLGELGKWEELHRYLKEISSSFSWNMAKIWTGNTMIDLILNSKMLQTEEKGIKFEIETKAVGSPHLSEQEIISLFGNLLDNSIEACEQVNSQDKWISLKIKKQHEMFYIELENSIGELPIKKKGKLISKKEDNRIHGYGIKNIQQIVEENRGIYTYQIKENSFVTCIAFFDDVKCLSQ